ncbi:Serine/threonine protein kinase PrkC, regulator of stationary phase [Labilithrix luteola]|uniref:Serine/threonine protein kinase PrkC, regulator of stationary phase n=1 Tax=Labilithrix luteola TaxID=1391654 RepID=A0A0K1QEF4_9BACT|nr:hypothetical protein [Labilithrix luteola]AKV03795.1 Serine/threonine protein kinase PrkC, regulator of stationary phase [Labilithrix luteola]
MKALALHPSARFSTAAEFQTAIDSYVASRPELRATSKELGKFVADLFSDKRAKLKSVIEAELGRVGQEKSSLIPVFSPTTTSTGGSAGAASALAQSQTVAVPELPRSKWRLWALGAVAVVAASALVVVLARGKEPSIAATAASTSSQASCEVTIRVTPPDAKIFLDDAPLDTNPATTTLPRNSIKHRVRGEVAGYSAKSEWITIEGAQMTVDLALDPEPASQPSGAKSGKVEATKETKKVPVWMPASKVVHPAPPPAVSTPPSLPSRPSLRRRRLHHLHRRRRSRRARISTRTIPGHRQSTEHVSKVRLRRSALTWATTRLFCSPSRSSSSP